MPCSVRPGIIFYSLESGKHVGIGPAAIAGIGPAIIIRLLAPDIDAAIDCAASAEQLAAREIDLAVMDGGITGQRLFPIIFLMLMAEKAPFVM